MTVMTYEEIQALASAANSAISESRTAEEKFRIAGRDPDRRNLRALRRKMEDLYDDLIVARNRSRGRGAALSAVTRNVRNATSQVREARIRMQNLAKALSEAANVVDILRELLRIIGPVLA